MSKVCRSSDRMARKLGLPDEKRELLAKLLEAERRLFKRERKAAYLRGGAEGWRAASVLMGTGVPEEVQKDLATKNAAELEKQCHRALGGAAGYAKWLAKKNAEACS